jgi:hypothetical protein
MSILPSLEGLKGNWILVLASLPICSFRQWRRAAAVIGLSLVTPPASAW